MNALVRVLTGRRSWIIALVGLLLGGWMIAGLGQAERSPDSLSTLPAGFESTQGQALLGELPDEGSSTAIVLFTRDDGQITDDLPGLAEVMAGVAETYDTGEEAPAVPVDGAEGDIWETVTRGGARLRRLRERLAAARGEAGNAHE